VTCITAIVDEGVIYIGGDRGVSDDTSILSLSTPKIKIRGSWIYGYAGSLGNGQLLDFIELPIVEDSDDPYMLIRLTIVEELKKAYESFGSTSEESETDYIIGCKGRLFEMSSGDWGVAEVKEASIGSGGNFALGSLYTSIDKEPIERIGSALGAAITYSPTCQGPIDIIYI
jgi:ATP-dependent protease HslVU (ClpYQ) peptidase subunit